MNVIPFMLEAPQREQLEVAGFVLLLLQLHHVVV